MSVFEPAFRFTTTASFLPTVECSELTTIVKSIGEELSGFWFYQSSQESVESAAALFESQPAVNVVETTDASIGGAPGIRMVIDLVDNLVQGPYCGQSFITSRGDRQTVYIVDVAGGVVMIAIDDIPGVSDDDVQSMIDSIVWRDLS